MLTFGREVNERASLRGLCAFGDERQVGARHVSGNGLPVQVRSVFYGNRGGGRAAL
jgi:hypothetical protein